MRNCVNGTMINQNDANAELISKIGFKNVAVIHDTTDYGKGHNEYFSKAFAKLNCVARACMPA